MLLTTKEMQINVSIGSQIFVKGMIVSKGKELNVRIDGHCKNTGNDSSGVLLEIKDQTGKDLQEGKEISLCCEIVEFHGSSPIVQFKDDYRRIVLNNIDDVTGIIGKL